MTALDMAAMIHHPAAQARWAMNSQGHSRASSRVRREPSQVRHRGRGCADLGGGDSGEQAEPQGGEAAASHEQGHHHQQQDQAAMRPGHEGGGPDQDRHSQHAGRLADRATGK
jgi:hypothetical protein